MATGMIRRIFKRHSLRARSRGRILKSFADKIGLVYFGVVDQHMDEHEVIRGLTVSTTHKDDHYAVGAFDGYDISIVDRFDVVLGRGHTPTEHSWIIMQLTLDIPNLPHVFLSPIDHTADAYAKFFSAHAQMKPVNDTFIKGHSDEFHRRYEVYAASTKALEIEEVLPPQVTQTIAASLWPHAVELFEGKLYVYTTGVDITSTVLETCLESALWLARAIDKDEEN
jgi:hypothetical protein